MRHRLIITTLALIAIGLSAAGCGERDEPVGELKAPFPATAQGDGETPVTLEERPTRIVALEVATAEFVEALASGDRLIGVPEGVAAGPPDVETVVSPLGRIDVERVIRLEPDLVLATADTDAVELGRIEQRLGVPIYIQPSRSVDDLVRTVFDLGTILGEPVRARELANGIRTRLAVLDETIGNASPVAVFADTGFFVTPPEGSLFRNLLGRAGAELVPAGVLGGVAPSPAEIAGAEPVVYFATSESRVTLESLREDSRLSAIPAVRDGRVVIVQTQAVTISGPGVLDTLELIAAALHPDAFR